MPPQVPITNCCVHACRGFAAAVSLVFFYVGPLSTLVKVVKHKDSSSLNPPFSIMVFLNVVMWLSYGLVRYSLILSRTHALTHSLTHSITHSLIHFSSLPRSLTHSLI